jgi:hypothetical protein
MASQNDFSVENLIWWLETMPPDKRYDWTSPPHCLLGQWCASKGIKGAALRAKSIELARENDFYDIALLETHQCTFGRALERALAISSGDRKGEA